MNEGLGMINRRPIPASTIIFTCPPYSCVPYETRKRFVCAYCFADTQPIEPSGESGEQVEAVRVPAKKIENLMIDH